MSEITALLDEAALRLSAIDERDGAALEALQQRLDTLAELLGLENRPRCAETAERLAEETSESDSADSDRIAERSARSLDGLEEILREETDWHDAALPTEPEPEGAHPAAAVQDRAIVGRLERALEEQVGLSDGAVMLDGFLVTKEGHTLLAQLERAWREYATVHTQTVDLAMEEEVCWH